MSFILKMLLPYLVEMAFKFGIPPVLEWIYTKLPWVPKDAVAQFIELVRKAIEDAMHPTANVQAVKAQLHEDAKACFGVGCVADVKGLE